MAEEFDIVRAQNLPAATSVSDNDMLLVVQGGTLKRVIPSLMKGRPGDPGLTPYLGVTDTYIRWRRCIRDLDGSYIPGENPWSAWRETVISEIERNSSDEV